MKRSEVLTALIDQYQYGIDSLPFVLDYIKYNFSHLEIKSATPHSFTIGSNNNGEDISYQLKRTNTLFYGKLFISINPNDGDLQDEQIKLRYRSYWNQKPFFKYITRQIEIENLVNEASDSTELFDLIELEQDSTKYDLYVTFVGFKIDVI